MQVPGPSLGSPTLVGPRSGQVFCFTGTVNLFQFIQAPPPGAVLGQLNTPVGVAVPLVQSIPSGFGTTTLGAVDQQSATVCGTLLFQEGRLALDILFISPGVSKTTPGVSPLALLVLALLGLLPVVG
jgi:hypothetical protein